MICLTSTAFSGRGRPATVMAPAVGTRMPVMSLRVVLLPAPLGPRRPTISPLCRRSEEHTSELQSRQYLVCRLLLEKKQITNRTTRRRMHLTAWVACVYLVGCV